ncbi:hypothetical protein M0R45_007078 [Rubus argutus]|uniref:SWIM-type domain-containing protein n=1 Tax=Rubus argutus TaxID=59490 RepID=A0AAW1YTU6_RUBAR
MSVVQVSFCLKCMVMFSVMVDLQNWSCSCGQWRIKGFPCAHALAAIFKDGENPFEYIEAYFTSSNFKRCYDVHIVPIPDIDQLLKSHWMSFREPSIDKESHQEGQESRGFDLLGRESRPMRCGRCGRLGTITTRKLALPPI